MTRLADESEPETTDEPEYEWRCFGTVMCDSMFDQHGRECERLNDEARAEFYAEVVRDEIRRAL